MIAFTVKRNSTCWYWSSTSPDGCTTSGSCDSLDAVFTNYRREIQSWERRVAGMSNDERLDALGMPSEQFTKD